MITEASGLGVSAVTAINHADRKILKHRVHPRPSADWPAVLWPQSEDRGGPGRSR